MQRNNTWRALLILFVTAWAFYEIYPPADRNLIDTFEERASAKGTNFTALVAKARELGVAVLDEQGLLQWLEGNAN